jgi:hypothetical protein
MKKLVILSIAIIATFAACKKEQGCTDSTATNYSEKAEEDDGSCTFVTTDTSTGATTEAATYYFKATINGAAVNYDNSSGEGYTPQLAYLSSGPATSLWVGQQFGIIHSTDANTGGFATIVKYFGAADQACDDYKVMFSEKSYAYGSLANTTGGVFVSYYDAGGTFWASDLGSGNTTGSNFTITSHQDVDGTGYDGITTATFNCTVYDGNGNSQVVTDGEIKSISVGCF